MIYCRFWELDGDHDCYIDKDNLIKYGNHALTYRIVDRIFSQVGFRNMVKLRYSLTGRFSLDVDLWLCLYLRLLGNLRAKLKGR